ncbi:MAG TPA: hypothetical protein VGX68_24200, partial [Thermoanaerobaculia bacterium]|nr:hypothetical protein [Thermoanaerobaculia bacterium]
MVEELLYLNNPSLYEATPPGLSDHDHDTLVGDSVTRIKLIHQRTDRIVQINSALSYVTSQLHSGTLPILERRCLVRRYSLLGIGTAIRALVRLARHVEVAFSEGRVESVLVNLFSLPTSRPLPGLV